MEKLDRDFTKNEDGITQTSPLWVINSYILMRVSSKVDELVERLNEMRRRETRPQSES